MRTRRIQYCYRQKEQKEIKWHLARNPWLCKGTLHTSTEYRHAFLLLRVCTQVSLKNKRFKVALRILKKQCYHTIDMHVWKMRVHHGMFRFLEYTTVLSLMLCQSFLTAVVIAVNVLNDSVENPFLTPTYLQRKHLN